MRTCPKCGSHTFGFVFHNEADIVMYVPFSHGREAEGPRAIGVGNHDIPKYIHCDNCGKMVEPEEQDEMWEEKYQGEP